MDTNYKKILREDEVEVDYYNDGKPMIRVSLFRDYHFRDEYFCNIPEVTVELLYPFFGRNKNIGKCGRCKETFRTMISSDSEVNYCPFCGAKFIKKQG